jgi:peptide/nickel transport system substrate-binding protein
VIHAIVLALLAALLALTPTPSVAAGKDFVIGLSGDATSLNPVIATDGQSYIAEWPIFDSLLELDQSLNVKPLLAESWEVSRDGLTYTFRLKRGVKWHDGKPFTARDVAFTFYSVLDPKVTTPHRAYFDALAGFPELTAKENPKRPDELAVKPIEVVDDYTVRFRLRYPSGSFLAVLVNPRAGIVPEHLLKGTDLNTAEFNRRPVGTGPFKLVEWRRGERLVMEANDQYHGGRPALDRLIFRIIPDSVVLLQELRAGGVDFIENPPLTEVARLKQTPNVKVLVADNTSYTYFGWREDLAPFTDVRVRRALYHAIDVPSIVKEVLQGYAAVSTGQFPPSSWAFDPSVKPYAYDPAKAKALLAEGGYSGQELTLHAGYGTMVNDKQLLETVADMWSQVGVKAKVDMMEMARRQKMNNDRTTPPNGMLLGNPQSTLLDIDGALWRIFHPNGFNGKYWAGSQPGNRFHDMMEQARYMLDQKKRKEIYTEATRIVHDEKPWIELFQEYVIYGVSKRVTFKPRADFRLIAAEMTATR